MTLACEDGEVVAHRVVPSFLLEFASGRRTHCDSRTLDLIHKLYFAKQCFQNLLCEKIFPCGMVEVMMVRDRQYVRHEVVPMEENMMVEFKGHRSVSVEDENP